MGRAFEYRKAAKMKRWGNMSRIFPKLAKAVQMAAKEGGPDPDMNAALRVAIQNAKAQNMPKTNIEAAIKRATGKDAEDFQEVLYEGKGPHGVLIVVECATDNTTRTVANVKSYFNKTGGALVPTGSLDYMFNRKAVFEFNKPEGFDPDDFELEMIDFGLQRLEVDEDTVYAYGEYTEFGNLATAFEKMGIEVEKSDLQRLPTSPVDFTDEQMEDIEKLIDKLEDDDDVQAVFNNLG
ncbi:MAG: YebC/PmpR family DNA-binding regulatory protein [Saprospiraceae bacterium]|jgi:YebC/PmpR family DNA-binding regulatory protein|tara:strand:+ start:487 stop:1197 length:711 start_codon:yes stop_codon:yes gene_type:complete